MIKNPRVTHLRNGVGLPLVLRNKVKSDDAYMSEDQSEENSSDRFTL